MVNYAAHLCRLVNTYGGKPKYWGIWGKGGNN